MKNTSLSIGKELQKETPYQVRFVGNREVATLESFAKEYSEGITSLNYNEVSDEVLIRLYLKNEDEWAFNEIVNRYGEKIHRLAFRITHNTRNADDVLQEVFMILVQQLETFREEAKFSTWLYRVATHASLAYLRKEKRYENEMSLEDYQPYEESGVLGGVVHSNWSNMPDDALIDKEGKGIIEKAISEIPEKYRIVLQLRDLEGLSNPEVGNILELSVAAVKSRIHRARHFLRHKLSDYFYEWSEAI
ncbi:sigma-70 family RNA polymerase sigma factor [Desulfobacterota bacterium AH_259_B03_O07]|nr:sigma-70 family RNA polymerase sigma factor [Desulfobacterota bacterium AH_259_B03_O07]